MGYYESLNKTGQQLQAVATEDFTFHGTHYELIQLCITPEIFRAYSCPPNCGGCCRRWTLDYLPHETPPDCAEQRDVEVNGKTFPIMSVIQKENLEDYTCRFLNKIDGRCGIYGEHPFSCDFEILRFTHRANRSSLRTQLYTRGGAMRRVDGGRGAQCEILPCTDATVVDIARRLGRLADWADYFEIKHALIPIIEWVRSGPHTYRFDVPKSDKKKGFFV